MNKVKRMSHKATNNELDLVVYWGGVMGDEEDYVAKMRIDQLQGAKISGSASTTMAVCPSLSVTSLPFLFTARDWDEVRYIKNKIRKRIMKDAEKRGFNILALIDLDFDQFYSTRYKMNTLDDFRRCNILTWFGAIEEEALKALDASPIPVNVPEIVTSMRSGVCDTAISPSLWWVAEKKRSKRLLI